MGDGVHDGEAQAAAAGVSIACVVEAHESVEHPLAFGFGDAVAVVVDHEHCPSVVLAEADGDAAAGMARGVVRQVAQQLAEQLRVAVHAGRADPGFIHRDAGAPKPRRLGEREVVQVDGLVRDGRTLVQARQEQERVDESLEAEALVERDIRKLLHRGRPRGASAPVRHAGGWSPVAT